jgi:hypothetical protein
MKTSAKHIQLVALLLVMLHWSAQAFDRIEVTKKVFEKYSLDANEVAALTNKYGKMHINTWDKSEITVEVTVRAWAGNERRAKEILDRIEIKYGKTGNTVHFETIINSSGSININSNNGFEINYMVNMPAKSGLKLNNRYGAVFLDNFSGSLDATIKYGSFKANKITGANKKLDIAYSSADIEQLENGTLDLSYGNGIIREGGKVTVNNRYGKMTYENVKELRTDTKYGGILIENEAETIIGNMAYSDFKVHRLKKEIRMEARYAGSFSIDEVSKGFSEIDLNGAYSSFTVYFGSGQNFEFSTSTAYGSIKMDVAGADIRRDISQSQTQTLEGQVGKGGGKVRINTKYGSIRMR